MNIKAHLESSIQVKQKILANEELLADIEQCAAIIVKAFETGGRLLICGNGGSAADAQHIAAELSGRYGFDRPPLDAEALHVNTSYLTAVSNDYSFDEIYARLIQAKGRKGDVLIAISTSGSSPNIVKAVEKANSSGMTSIGMTGATGGKLKEICAKLIAIPSVSTPAIQEAHITIGHIICGIVEEKMFK